MRLTQGCREDGLPYFVPHFLGEKCPLVDVFVELEGVEGTTPYFFAQVKATREGYNTKGRLKVQVDKEDVDRLVRYPGPTYVIGIDEPQERAYVVAVHAGMKQKISSLSTGHELNPITLQRLWEEVIDYWKDKDMALKSSRFLN